VVIVDTFLSLPYTYIIPQPVGFVNTFSQNNCEHFVNKSRPGHERVTRRHAFLFVRPSLRPHTLSRVECCLRPTDLLHAVGLTRSPCDLWLLPMRRVGYTPRGGKSLLPVGLMRLVRKSASIGGGFFPSPLDTIIIPHREGKVNSQIAQIFTNFSCLFCAKCRVRARADPSRATAC
jgi:hypothetical protein